MSSQYYQDLIMPNARRIAPVVFSFAASAVAAASAQAAAPADSYPNRPIRMIIAFAPGGGTDIIGRVSAQGISEKLGQHVVVDNRPGAGGNIGTDMVAKAPADGYTLITAGTGTHAINQSLYAKLPFDTVRDFAPVSLVAETPYMMVVPNNVAAKTVKEFIALAKSQPGKINMASSGAGGMPHLSGELFKMMTNVEMAHIPYKGTGAVFTDLIAGRMQVLFGDIVATYPHVQGGRLRALGVTSPKRIAQIPDIPTIAESGVTGYDSVGWFSVFAPAGTPPAVIAKLNDAISSFVKKPEIKERLLALGAEVVASSPDELGRIQKRDLARWAKVIKESGAKAE